MDANSKFNEADYTLCQLAEVYLGMASASIRVECMLSSATLIANGKRSTLKPYRLEQIPFVIAGDSLMYRLVQKVIPLF